MNRIALTLGLALFAFSTVNAQYYDSDYGYESSPCASGNSSLQNSHVANSDLPNTYSSALNQSNTAAYHPAPLASYNSTCASGNCPVSNSYVPTSPVSTCASGNCSLGSYSAATDFESVQVLESTLIPIQNPAFSAHAVSTCASGNCSLSNYSYAPAHAVTPCASGNCSLAYGGFASQPAESLCANGNCPVAATIPVSISNRSISNRSISNRSISRSQPTSSNPVRKLNVRRLLAQAVAPADAQAGSNTELAWWVQPESEIQDSQPGIDPHDVGCGNANNDEVIVVESTRPSFEQTALESPLLSPLLSAPTLATSECASGNCHL